MAKALNAGDYELLSVIIKEEKLDGSKIPLVVYRESVTSPSIEVELVISDTNDQRTNLMTKLPILCGDPVIISFKSLASKGEVVTVNTRIYDIVGGNRNQDTQQYVLKCISGEGYTNLEKRFEKLYKIKVPDTEIVPDVLTNALGSGKPLKLGKYPSIPLTVAAMRDRPFDFLIKHICKRSVPEIVAKGEGKGSAGYLLWETARDGFVFMATDEVFAAPPGAKVSPSPFVGEKEKNVYFHNVAASNKKLTPEDEARNVISFKLVENDNAERANIKGSRVNLIGFFDSNSLSYNEAIFDMAENFGDFGHLAKGPPPVQTGSPSRIMTKLYNNEMYEFSDQKAQDQVYDKIRFALAQQLVRHSLNGTHRVEINIHGNSNLHAGDKIFLSVFKSKSMREVKEDYDKKQTGYYTIATVVHSMQSNGMKTSLLLYRDIHNEEV